MTKIKNSEEVLNQLVIDYLHNAKKKRKWRWVWRSVSLLFLAWVVVGAFVTHHEEISARINPHVGVIDIKGQIMDSQSANADNLAESLKTAYESKGLKALVFRIDSPGGSPVQADYMFNSIRYYQSKYPEVKTYAVCADICASAAYYIAAAAHDIYADPSSIVGSIGVIYNGFGFVDTMEKLGVSRRLVTAGAHKGFLDQFSPEKPEDRAYLQKVLDTVHTQFINQVKIGRGSRIKIDDQTFSGLFWTGMQAKERGLIDGFGSTADVGREVVGIDKFVDYTTKESVLDLLAKNVSASVIGSLPEALGLKPSIS